ncbi:hypothetical protein BH10ACI1_BH10ACI1_07640 [soil metagenome]
MKERKCGSQNGKSIIELVIILVVVTIIVTIAITNTNRAQTNLQRQNFAREFKINLERARFDSVKRRPTTIDQMAQIIITSNTSYRVLTDLNQDGVLTLSDAKTISISSSSGVKILGTNLVYPITIRFDWRGQVALLNGNDDEVTPTFAFCEGSCTLATVNATNANIITISPTGTISMLSGNQSQPTIGAPNVSSVNTSSNINPWVTIFQNSNSETPTPTPNQNPTPTPTPTATPTPNQNPTPTPTATPNQSPTPTPTATPVYCVSGQKPSQGCTCKLPMTVRANGKCQ